MTQWGLDTLFNPAKRHMDEEKRRLQSTREEVGDNSGGKRVDFESGKVTIRRPDAGESGDTADHPADVDAATDAADSTGGQGSGSKATRAAKAPSAAAIRAAKRRGREPR